jgi:hypothetical protein
MRDQDFVVNLYRALLGAEQSARVPFKFDAAGAAGRQVFKEQRMQTMLR